MYVFVYPCASVALALACHTWLWDTWDTWLGRMQTHTIQTYVRIVGMHRSNSAWGVWVYGVHGYGQVGGPAGRNAGPTSAPHKIQGHIQPMRPMHPTNHQLWGPSRFAHLAKTGMDCGVRRHNDVHYQVVYPCSIAHNAPRVPGPTTYAYVCTPTDVRG